MRRYILTPVYLLIPLILVFSAYSYTQTTEMIPMRDSVHLATEIYTPAEGEGPFPVILERTPYNRNLDEMLASLVTDFLGYIYVSQNLRGRYDSEGEPMVFLSDAWGPLKDGYDCIQWISEQSWCDGHIGMFGASAPGMTQYMAAGAMHPELDCIVPIMAGPSMYHHVAYNGGALRRVLVEEWLDDIGAPTLIDTIANHPNYDTLWQAVDLSLKYDSLELPSYHVTGWYDMYTDGQIEAFQRMQAAFGNQKIIIAPIGHGDAVGTVHQGDLYYPPNAEVSEEDLTLIAVEWYGYWLKGEASGIMSEPPVRFYLTGDCDTDDTLTWNRWINIDQWPPVGMTYKEYYLKNEGSLDTIAPITETIDTFIYDPDYPCPTIGGREYIGLSTGYGPKNQNIIESRSDVLIYTTAVLEETLFVCGKVRMILYGASDRFDTDWTVRLTDVYPDGRSILMTDNVLQGRHRHGLDVVDSLEPGVPDTFDIDVWSIGHVFNAGHKVRVIISSSNHPRFERNANNGGPFMVDDPFTFTATNCVYRTPELASHLLLPVVSFESFGIDEQITELPKSINIMAHPNPFNSAITLTFQGINSIVNAQIFDLSGRLIANLTSPSIGTDNSTSIIWEPSEGIGSGIYLVRVDAGGYSTTARLVYLK
ncbi:CocE/NonD family hydrolase [bacterium]|nr:CocE/NonD family hydrolase [bacterium]